MQRMEKDLLHKYFNGETTQEEEKRIMDWAESSPENYKLYLEERRLWNALLINYSRTNQKSRPSAKNNSLTLWKIISVAASIALILTFAWIQVNLEKAPQGLQAVLVPAGQRVQIILEDGTKVWLNSKTSLTYPTSFGSKSREVELNGEGYFEVARNEEKPFIVKTKKYDVKVLGTTFNVSAYEHAASTFETSLLEGSVDVYTTTGNALSVHLEPHEKVSEVDGVLKKDTIGFMDHFQWKDGLICLDDEPFANLMKKFSIYYDIQIDIDNPKVLDYRCTGKFRQNDGVEYALRVIQKDLKFKYIRDDELNTIIIK